jgi:hypothetical protein
LRPYSLYGTQPRLPQTPQLSEGGTYHNLVRRTFKRLCMAFIGEPLEGHQNALISNNESTIHFKVKPQAHFGCHQHTCHVVSILHPLHLFSNTFDTSVRVRALLFFCAVQPATHWVILPCVPRSAPHYIQLPQTGLRGRL